MQQQARRARLRHHRAGEPQAPPEKAAQWSPAAASRSGPHRLALQGPGSLQGRPTAAPLPQLARPAVGLHLPVRRRRGTWLQGGRRVLGPEERWGLPLPRGGPRVGRQMLLAAVKVQGLRSPRRQPAAAAAAAGAPAGAADSGTAPAPPAAALRLRPPPPAAAAAPATGLPAAAAVAAAAVAAASAACAAASAPAAAAGRQLLCVMTGASHTLYVCVRNHAERRQRSHRLLHISRAGS